MSRPMLDPTEALAAMLAVVTLPIPLSGATICLVRGCVLHTLDPVTPKGYFLPCQRSYR